MNLKVHPLRGSPKGKSSRKFKYFTENWNWPEVYEKAGRARFLSIMTGSLCVLLLSFFVQAPEPLYRLPFEDGTTHPCTQSFNGGSSHTGTVKYAIDFSMAEGTKVSAARGGKVIVAKEKESKNGSNGMYGGTGNHIKIDHGDGTVGVYMHLKVDGALVEVGDQVLQGDVIGLSGNTGNSTGPHLHFEVDRGFESIPIRFADVETDEGVPLSGKSYTSHNTPGIPAETKNKLIRLQRAARLAWNEGAYHLAYRAYGQISNEKLKVKYQPQEEAKNRMKEIETMGDQCAEQASPDRFEESARDLMIAKVQFAGTPSAEKINKATSLLKKDPRWKAAQKANSILHFQAERFYKGLRYELEEKWASARSQYKNVLTRSEETAIAKRAGQRLKIVNANLSRRFPKKR